HGCTIGTPTALFIGGSLTEVHVLGVSPNPRELSLGPQANPARCLGAFLIVTPWRFLWNARAVASDMQNFDEKFRLTIPIEDAFGFSMGEYDLGQGEPSDGMRQLVGV